MTAYFVSDIHLVSPAEEKTEVFNRFLQSIAAGGSLEKATHLFLVGDIFDLWVGNHRYFSDKFHTTVELIRALAMAGVQVHYFEGNHDLHLDRFWQERLGIKIHADAESFDLAGLRVRIEHGDLINPEDEGYLFLRWFLRTSPMTLLAHSLPAPLVRLIGERASQASRNYTSTAKELPKDQIRKLIRTHAERVGSVSPFDLIITGHVHVEDDFRFKVAGREMRSVNLGSWFDGPKAFVLNEGGGNFTALK
ncbi:MAG TPA: UDP-2,3-diacylglucosamine diphosphatase [Bdellovibrionales bacterium]|nr:UDP-2,3-diacylglucosamine diphosphatase [Bdellovibrionales bacterium]